MCLCYVGGTRAVTNVKYLFKHFYFFLVELWSWVFCSKTSKINNVASRIPSRITALEFSPESLALSFAYLYSLYYIFSLAFLQLCNISGPRTVKLMVCEYTIDKIPKGWITIKTAFDEVRQRTTNFHNADNTLIRPSKKCRITVRRNSFLIVIISMNF